MLARKRALGRSTVRSMLYEWSRKRRDVTSPEVFSDEEASFMTRFAFRVLVVAMILALLPTVSFAAGESSAGSANTTAAPPAATATAAAATLEPAAPQTTGPTTPAVIAAVAPVRVLQVDPPKREGLIPDIKMGSGARLKP